MDRRAYLTAVASGTALALAGCSSDGDGGDVQDSDGDGVVDSQDYAPRDPDVQDQADVRATAEDGETPRPRSTPTDAPTFTDRPTGTPVPDAPADHVAADVQAIVGRTSHFVHYGLESATCRIVPYDMRESIAAERFRVWVLGARYPLDEFVVVGSSPPVERDEARGTTVDVPVDGGDGPGFQAGGHYHYVMLAAPAEYESLAEIPGDEVWKLAESNRFSASGTGGGDLAIEADPHPDLADLGDLVNGRYNRENVEGAYIVRMDGVTSGEEWSATMILYKSVYLQRAQASRGRTRASIVEFSMNEGVAATFASVLSRKARKAGFTEKAAQVSMVIDYVQNLPYVPDDVGTGFDDYTKFIAETMVEGGGDCEDTAIFLAAVLQSAPFEYDCVLLQPPGHMATGIYGGDDLPGTAYELDGRRYYYIETTGSRWSIGALPQEYEGTDVRVIQV